MLRTADGQFDSRFREDTAADLGDCDYGPATC